MKHVLHKGDVEEAIGTGPVYRGTLAQALLHGRESDHVQLADCEIYTTIGAIRELMEKWLKLTPQAFAALSQTRQNAISDKMSRKLNKEYKRQYGHMGGAGLVQIRTSDETKEQAESRKERTRLHKELNDHWARGELRLERPMGSSLHLLKRYNREVTENKSDELLADKDLQCIVVENDWARAAPPAEVGDQWRVPFPLCCWEFRISGVRVLAFTYIVDGYVSSDQDAIGMFCVYGYKKHWMIDDYKYGLYSDPLERAAHDESMDNYEFRRVAEMVRREIRASCIMLDAQICHREEHQPDEGLVRHARREKVPEPRNYVVVRLVREHQRRYRSRTKVAIASMRTPQRGHWRRGTYVHYDDQDSGEEQYINSGGFVVSRTWRRWHFAGDPNNIIEREYRL